MTHVTIVTNGGYGSASTVLYIAGGFATGVAAIVLGTLAGDRVWTMVAAGVVILVAGELLNVAAYAEASINARAAARAPIEETAAKHRSALARLDAAIHSDKIGKAEAAKMRISSEAMTQSAGATCAKNCRAILESQVSAAQTAIDTAKQDVTREIEAPRSDLAAYPIRHG